MPEMLHRVGVSQRPKILVVTERYWPEGSGGGLVTHLITKLLADKFDVTVVARTKKPESQGLKVQYEPASATRKNIYFC